MKDSRVQTSARRLESPDRSSPQIYGSTQFFFSKDLLQTFYSSPGIGSMLVAACVTDSSTGTRRLQLSWSLSCLLNLAIFCHQRFKSEPDSRGPGPKEQIPP